MRTSYPAGSGPYRVQFSNLPTGYFPGPKGPTSGTTVEFTVAAKIETESSDWVFHGTVSGTSMTGTVSTTLGTFQFSGSKGQ